MSNTDFDERNIRNAIKAYSATAKARSAGVNGSPERTAKALDLQSRSGIPASVIEGAIENWDARIKLQERAGIVDNSSAIQTFVTSNPNAASVAQDEFQQLDGFASAVNAAYPKKKQYNADDAFWEGYEEAGPYYSMPGADSEFGQFLSDIGIFNAKDKAFSPIKAVNESVIRAIWGAGELSSHIFNGVTYAAGETGAAFVDALGGNPTGVKREIINFGNFLGLEFFGNYTARPPGFSPYRTAHQNRMQIELEMQRNFAEMEAGALDKLVEAKSGYKTPQRAPRVFQEFLQQNNDTTIVVDTMHLRDLYAQKGITPGPGDPVFGWYPGIAQAIEQPTIEVPISAYLTYIDPEVHSKIYPGVRRESGMSIEQVKEAQELLDESISEFRNVEEGVAQELRGQGINLDNLREKPFEGPEPITLRELAPDPFVVQDAQRYGYDLPRYFDILSPTGELLAKLILDIRQNGREIHVNSLYGEVRPDRTMPSTVAADPYARRNYGRWRMGRKAVESLHRQLAAIFPEAEVITAYRVSGARDISGRGPADASVPIRRPELGRRATEIDSEGNAVEGRWVLDEFVPNTVPNEILLETINRKYEERLRTELGIVGESEVLDVVAPRAVASAEDTARLRRELYLDGVFRDEQSAGMTREQFAAYSKRIEERVKLDEEMAIRRAIRLAKRLNSQEYKTIFNAALSRFERAFDNRPDVQAARLLRSFDDGMKINADEFGTVRSAPRGTVSSNGMSADQAAELLGFRSGEDLINALDALAHEEAPKGRPYSPDSFRRTTTRRQALEETLARIEDPVDRIEAAVDAVVHDDVTRVLYDELRVMRRQNENEMSPPLALDELKAKFAENFGNMFVKEVKKLSKFLRQIADMGRRAEVMLLRNKPIEAFKAKNQQLMAVMNLREAAAFARQRAKTEALTRKYAKKQPKAVDTEYADQVRALMAKFGVPIQWPTGAKALADVPNLADFVARRRWFMEEFPDDPFPFQQGIKVDNMTVNQYRAFSEMLIALDTAGRRATKVFEAGRSVSREGILKVMRGMVAQSKDVQPNIRRQAVRPVFRAFDALITKVETIFDRFELWRERGPFARFIVEPLNAAMSNRSKVLAAFHEKMGGLVIKNPRKLVVNDRFYTRTGELRRIDRGDVVTWALNAGNRRNRDLLVDTLLPPPDIYGPIPLELTKAYREQRVMEFIQRNMTDEDWAFVEKLWGAFAWLKPQIDALYKRLSGSAPATVEGIETLGRKGGYFPIMRDKYDIGTMPHEKDSPFELDYDPVTTPNRHTKPRTGNSDPIMVETAYTKLPQAIMSMIHDLTMREAVQNAHKLLSDSKLQVEIATRYGQEYSDMLSQWLRFVANGVSEADRQVKTITKFFRAARTNMASYLLGYNLSTILTPTTGKLAWHLPSVMWMNRNFDEFSEFALAKSPLLQDRKFVQQSDLWDVHQDILGMRGRWTKMQRMGATYGTHLLYAIDQRMAILGWNIEYKNALARGWDDKNAVALADKYVRDFHGSATPVNRAQIFNLGEQWRWAGFMYSWANTQYNLVRGAMTRGRYGVRQVRKGDIAGARRNFSSMLANSMAAVVTPVLISSPFYTEWSEDDNLATFYMKGFAGHMLSLFPFIREAAYFAQVGQNPQASAIYAMIANYVNAVEGIIEAASGEADSDLWAKKTVDAAGMTIGAPLGQFSRSGYFFWNVITGDETPDSPLEWARGIIKGYSESGGQRE